MLQVEPGTNLANRLSFVWCLGIHILNHLHITCCSYCCRIPSSWLFSLPWMVQTPAGCCGQHGAAFRGSDQGFPGCFSTPLPLWSPGYERKTSHKDQYAWQNLYNPWHLLGKNKTPPELALSFRRGKTYNLYVGFALWMQRVMDLFTYLR